MLKKLKIEELYLRKLSHEQLVIHALSLHKDVHLLLNAQHKMNELRTSFMSKQNQIIRKQEKSLEKFQPLVEEWSAYQEFKKVHEPIILAQKIKLDRSHRGSVAASARHVETYEIKARCFKWFDDNATKFGSMDEASQALTRVEPIKFRAARGYMTEWKKLQSASKE